MNERFPRHFAGASLKLGNSTEGHSIWTSFPRHFAGASLKRISDAWSVYELSPFSPAFRWGLIEAARRGRLRLHVFKGRFPRHFAGASLKRAEFVRHPARGNRVFPGISLGPH